MVVTGGSINQKDLTVLNGVTYTVSIQTLSSTELPSAVVDVPYQDRTSQLLAIQLVCPTLFSVTGQTNTLPLPGKDRELGKSLISHQFHTDRVLNSCAVVNSLLPNDAIWSHGLP